MRYLSEIFNTFTQHLTKIYSILSPSKIISISYYWIIRIFLHFLFIEIENERERETERECERKRKWKIERSPLIERLPWIWRKWETKWVRERDKQRERVIMSKRERQRVWKSNFFLLKLKKEGWEIWIEWEKYL